MPETRREIFRTSIITAIGVAAGAVAGYEIAEASSRALLLTPPDTGSVLALRDSKSKIWYLFYFATASQCELYSLSCVPTITTTANINTTTWFQVAQKTAITSGTKNINYLDKNGNQTTLSLTLSGGYLNRASLDNLNNVLPPSGPQTAGSWYEIGKQTHN